MSVKDLRESQERLAEKDRLLDEAAKNIEYLSVEEQKLKQEVVDAEESLKAHASGLEKQLASLNQLYEGAIEKLTSADNAAAELRADLGKTQELLAAEKQRAGDKERDLLELRHDFDLRISRHESEKGLISKDLERAHEDLQEVSQRLGAEQVAHSQTSALLADTKSQLSRIESESDVASAELSSMKIALEEKDIEAKALRDELGRVTYDLGAKASELSFRSEELDRLHQELVEAGQNAVAVSSFDNLRSELEDALRALSAEKSAHDLLSQESVRIQDELRASLK